MATKTIATATVRAVKKKLIPTRAALVLVNRIETVIFFMAKILI